MKHPHHIGGMPSSAIAAGADPRNSRRNFGTSSRTDRRHAGRRKRKGAAVAGMNDGGNTGIRPPRQVIPMIMSMPDDARERRRCAYGGSLPTTGARRAPTSAPRSAAAERTLLLPGSSPADCRPEFGRRSIVGVGNRRIGAGLTIEEKTASSRAPPHQLSAARA